MNWWNVGCPVCFAHPLEYCIGRGTAFPHERRVAAAGDRHLCLYREGCLSEERRIWAQIARQLERISVIDLMAESALTWRRRRLRHESECPRCLETAGQRPACTSHVPRFPSGKPHR